MKNNVVLLLVTVCLLAGSAGCSSSNNNSRSNLAPSENAKVKAEAVKGVVPPSNSHFSNITLGMNDNNVRKILGEPDDTDGYTTGKSHIPFYHGTDTARVEWMYKGEGRLVFSKNRYSGGLKVIRIDYNPDELK